MCSFCEKGEIKRTGYSKIYISTRANNILAVATQTEMPKYLVINFCPYCGKDLQPKEELMFQRDLFIQSYDSIDDYSRELTDKLSEWLWDSDYKKVTFYGKNKFGILNGGVVLKEWCVPVPERR